jgi:cytosine/adenosine deaminase-related metal-dependent hydrolase
MKKVTALAAKLGAEIHIHLAETAGELKTVSRSTAGRRSP